MSAADTIVTRIKTRHGRWGRPLPMPLEELATVIADSERQPLVERLARKLSEARVTLNGEGLPSEAHLSAPRNQLPYLIFASRFAYQGVHHWQQPTGLMLVSIPLDGDPHRTALLRHSVEQLPQTLMAFAGVSRRTLKVVVRCQPANGPLPADSTAYLRFLCLAQQQAARFLEAMTGCHVPVVEESLLRGCRMSQDSQVYVNAGALPLTVLSTAEELARYPLARTDRDGNFTSDPTWDAIERQRLDFYTCVSKAREAVAGETGETGETGASEANGANGATEAYGAYESQPPQSPQQPQSPQPPQQPQQPHPSYEPLVLELARLCRKSALPEESCVQRASYYTEWGLTTDAIRKIFRSVYADAPEGRPYSQMTEKERIARKVKEFFDRRYELRYNVMKLREEFRPRGIDYHPWQELTDRDINRIGQEQMMDAGAAWPIDIKQYAQSSLTPDYNPVHEFLAGCGTWDQKRNYIEQMAARVPCQYKQWPRLFHRWFLGMVATWLGQSRDHANAVVPMLVGPQGCRKSTFCKMLLPYSLREYYIDDIKLDNAEQVERMLGRMALVNIDEYNAKTDREQAKIKRILTERDVQVRRMRSESYTMLQRMASFIATTNERQPLTDATGSRRYLCVEVTGTIDTMTPVNYQQLYAQALYELSHGELCYMTPDEERQVQQHNEQFLNASTADILLTSYYEPAPRAQENFVRAVDILSDLQQHSRGSDRPNMSRLVKALKAAHFEYGAQKGIRGWYARKVADVGHVK